MVATDGRARHVREQRIRFTTAPDGSRLAYAIHGRGYPLVRAVHWLSHLQYDWESPVWRHWLAELGSRFTVLRYDERGCGLSDWDTEDLSFDAWVEDLEVVVEAAGFERFALLGMLQGAPAAIAYAYRHPERVSHLVIFGGYMLGYDHQQLTDLERQEVETVRSLLRVGWDRDNPVYRHFFTSNLIPDGDDALLRSYDELMRHTTSPENAAGFEEADWKVNVAALAPQIRVPTLVMHVDGDRLVSVASGRSIAVAVPGARFLLLPGQNHVIQPGDAAWPRFWDALEEFVGEPGPPASGPRLELSVSLRERTILELVARGLSNQEIADQLGLSPRTVERHLSNVYLKLGISGKAARAAAAATWAAEHGSAGGDSDNRDEG